MRPPGRHRRPPDAYLLGWRHESGRHYRSWHSWRFETVVVVGLAAAVIGITGWAVIDPRGGSAPAVLARQLPVVLPGQPTTGRTESGPLVIGPPAVGLIRPHDLTVRSWTGDWDSSARVTDRPTSRPVRHDLAPDGPIVRAAPTLHTLPLVEPTTRPYPTSTSSPTPRATPRPTPAITPTPMPTPTQTRTYRPRVVSSHPKPTPKPTPEPTPTVTPSASPTASPTPSPTHGHKHTKESPWPPTT